MFCLFPALSKHKFNINLIGHDIQITKNGPVNLMSKIPIEAEEIEQIMNR